MIDIGPSYISLQLLVKFPHNVSHLILRIMTVPLTSSGILGESLLEQNAYFSLPLPQGEHFLMSFTK